MHVAFPCPQCERPAQADLEPGAQELVCTQCGLRLQIPATSWEDNQLAACLACPSTDLFVRKDFPQRLGVAIVVLGFAVSCWTWSQYQIILTFAVLLGTALIDMLLFFLVGNVLCCYRCGATYRGAHGEPRHGKFSLETHEKHRQVLARSSPQAAARSAAAPPAAVASGPPSERLPGP